MNVPRRVAFLFAGQGAEEPRMGLEIADAFPGARALLDLAAAETRSDVGRLLRRGGADLQRTEVLQPVLVAVELGAVRALAGIGLSPALVAGHSLGELSAWAASGAIADEDAVRLAALRGRLMAREASRFPGGMLAVADCDGERVAALVSAARALGTLQVAAHNAPRDWTLSGEGPGLSEVLRHVPGRRLHVSGAWHSEAMRGACAPLRDAAVRVERRPARACLVSGATGACVERGDEPRVPELLAAQLVSPVLWSDAMRTLRQTGASDLVIAGPGRVMRGLVRANLGDTVAVHVVSEPRDLERAAEVLLA